MRPYIADLSGNRLAGVMTCIYKPTITKIVHTLYNGLPMIQTVGSAATTADVRIEATSAEMQRINQAEVEAELLAINYQDVTRYGYIEASVSWSPIVPGAVYEGSCRLLIEEVTP